MPQYPKTGEVNSMPSLSERVRDAKKKIERDRLHGRLNDILDATDVQHGSEYERASDAGSGTGISATLREETGVDLSIISKNRSPVATVRFEAESYTLFVLQLLPHAIALDNELLPQPDA